MRRITYLTAFFIVALFAVFAMNMSSSAKLKVFHNGSAEEIEVAKTLSFDYLGSRLQNYGITNVSELKVRDSFVDELSMAHTKFQQNHEGIPVFGGEAIVHLNADGSVFSMTDSLVSNISVRTKPDLSASEALERAESIYKVAHPSCDNCWTSEPKADLQILRHKDKDHLVYRIQLRREDGSHDTSMPVYFIDAHTGKKVWSYDNLQTATGVSLYSGTVTINSYLKTGTYYMEDLTRKVGTFDVKNGTDGASAAPAYRYTDTDDVWNATTQQAAVDAHYGLEKVYDYYLNVHGRRGIDGNGGPAYYTSADGVTGLISSRIHYSTNYNNAFWNGQLMTYGDGDGSTFKPLVTLDICGHEVTHGVTERTAALVYSGESGALNESMSDVFGSMIERYVQGESANTWKIGEQCYTPSIAGDALRYMDTPHTAGNSGFTADDDPDHYSERYTGTSDNGGVHINSGISNKAFYLVAKGGSHHLGGSMTGIGADKAAAIWYKALTAYMTSSTNFAGARTATLNAATAIYGATSAEYTAVATAWGLVGVGTVPGGGGGGTSAELITNGGFESAATPTVLVGSGAFYIANGNYPHAGTGYVYLGTTNNVASSLYQQITIPSTATTANLSFYLNTTSDETTTTTQYDKLYVEVRNTAGTLLTTLATYSNLNKTTAGSYALKGNFSLLAYKGQTVRVQFRATTDTSAQTTFRIDDLSVK